MTCDPGEGSRIHTAYHWALDVWQDGPGWQSYDFDLPREDIADCGRHFISGGRARLLVTGRQEINLSMNVVAGTVFTSQISGDNILDSGIVQ